MQTARNKQTFMLSRLILLSCDFLNDFIKGIKRIDEILDRFKTDVSPSTYRFIVSHRVCPSKKKKLVYIF